MATPVFAIVFVLPIEIGLQVILNKLSHFGMPSPTELTHKDRYPQSLHISQPGVHGLERFNWGAFEVVAQHRLVAVHVTSRDMREPTSKGKVKSDRFKTDICIWVFLPYCLNYTVIKPLELYPFCHHRKQQQRISNSISHKWFIDQFIGYHIGVTPEGLSYLLPELHKLLMQVTPGVVQVIKDISHIVSEVILSPLRMVTEIPVRFARRVHRYLFASREGEGFVSLDFVNKPNRYSVSTEFFRNDVLVEVKHGVNAILSKFVDQLNQLLDIGLVILILLGLYSSPPWLVYSYIAPKRTPFMPSSLQISTSLSTNDL